MVVPKARYRHLHDLLLVLRFGVEIELLTASSSESELGTRCLLRGLASLTTLALACGSLSHGNVRGILDAEGHDL